MLSPALSDSKTVLHVLDYAACLPVLLAMFMPDCPKPVQQNWLQRRTGKSRKTVANSLAKLEELNVLQKTTGGWLLNNGAKQLPLPINGIHSQASTTILDQQMRKISPSISKSGKISHQMGNFSPPLHENENVDDEFIPNVSNRSFHHHHRGKSGKFYPSTPTARLLTIIGMDAPVPEKYQDVPLEITLAHWWNALQFANNPNGFLRTSLKDNHPPKENFKTLAEALIIEDPENIDYLFDLIEGRQDGIICAVPEKNPQQLFSLINHPEPSHLTVEMIETFLKLYGNITDFKKRIYHELLQLNSQNTRIRN